ncbi:hypothetical protein MGYG_09039 [Nannizzia gypsea CBS 118893]|uniref:Uncharacterized protein n=1 Tax=Arthroderma gypseum (strain ATCC MYA-4604 / CBS 118893) TaxID=535722 RepID=E4UUL2_ARTGP|nr:hypothetical protein MGYG_09039 [Nannizzia gypsea CBS 118893]EFR00979.1 hypothetical protein MGYG_09039 [Nannizzia gypsea CBS 118893]
MAMEAADRSGDSSGGGGGGGGGGRERSQEQHQLLITCLQRSLFYKIHQEGSARFTASIKPPGPLFQPAETAKYPANNGLPGDDEIKKREKEKDDGRTVLWTLHNVHPERRPSGDDGRAARVRASEARRSQRATERVYYLYLGTKSERCEDRGRERQSIERERETESKKLEEGDEDEDEEKRPAWRKVFWSAKCTFFPLWLWLWLCPGRRLRIFLSLRRLYVSDGDCCALSGRCPGSMARRAYSKLVASFTRRTVTSTNYDKQLDYDIAMRSSHPHFIPRPCAARA